MSCNWQWDRKQIWICVSRLITSQHQTVSQSLKHHHCSFTSHSFTGNMTAQTLICSLTLLLTGEIKTLNNLSCSDHCMCHECLTKTQTSCWISEMFRLKMQKIITVNSIMSFHSHNDREPYKNLLQLKRNYRHAIDSVNIVNTVQF